MKSFIYLGLLIVFGFSGIVKAQPGNDAFMNFDQFFQNYSMINPASSDTSDFFTVAVGNSYLTGLFAGVNRLYFDLDVRLNSKISRGFSRIGALVISNNDGAFINRSRYYARYSWTNPLSKHSFISAGLALGVVSYKFKSSQAYSGGTASAFDGSAGIWFTRKKLRLGVSVQQIMNSILTPLQQSFELKPYWNFNLAYTSEISSEVRLTNHLYLVNYTEAPASFELASVATISEIVETGFNYKHKRGVAVFAGLRSIHIGKGRIRFMGSFLISTRNLSHSADNKFEVSAGYSL